MFYLPADFDLAAFVSPLYAIGVVLVTIVLCVTAGLYLDKIIKKF